MFFIAGGTGFVGSHLVQALAQNGRRGKSARCLVRDAKKGELCKKPGLESATGDITDRQSLEGKLDGCDIAVHLVGILEEKGDMTFEKVHVEGTRNLVEEAKKSGIKHLFFQSALGASPSSWSDYFRTKAEAEELVKTSGIPYTIFRPSLVVGRGDGFTEKLKELIQVAPIVPVPGSGNAKLQPIFIEDWVRCFMKIFSSPLPISFHPSPVFEFGGPEHLTYNEIIAQLMDAMGVNKTMVHLPLGAIRLTLPFSGITQWTGNLLGKKIPSVTKEQLGLLQLDNICDIKSVENNFGFKPMIFKEALKKFIN